MATTPHESPPERPNLCGTCAHGLVRVLRYPVESGRKVRAAASDTQEIFCTILREPAYDLQASVIECSRYTARPQA